MAKLLSEDQEYRSYIEIAAGPMLESSNGNADEVWQYCTLTLANGQRQLVYTAKHPSTYELEQSAFADYAKVASGYLLCRKPKDEVKGLVDQLSHIVDGKSSHAIFEPLEPSFELTVLFEGSENVRVTIFVDEGNVETAVCRWDALGLRFFTTRNNLLTFINELKQEFAC